MGGWGDGMVEWGGGGGLQPPQSGKPIGEGDYFSRNKESNNLPHGKFLQCLF